MIGSLFILARDNFGLIFVTCSAYDTSIVGLSEILSIFSAESFLISPNINSYFFSSICIASLFVLNLNFNLFVTTSFCFVSSLYPILILPIFFNPAYTSLILSSSLPLLFLLKLIFGLDDTIAYLLSFSTFKTNLSWF